MTESEKPRIEDMADLDFTGGFGDVAKKFDAPAKMTGAEVEELFQKNQDKEGRLSLLTDAENDRFKKEGYQEEVDELAQGAVVATPLKASQASEKVWSLLTDQEEVAFKKEIEDEVKFGPAVWHAKDGDRPVIINGILGWKNKQLFVSIEGSPSGIPVDELEYGAGVQDEDKETPKTEPTAPATQPDSKDVVNVPEAGISSTPEATPTPEIKVTNELPPAAPPDKSFWEKLKEKSKRYANDKDYQKQINKTAAIVAGQVAYRTAGTIFGVKFLGDIGLAFFGTGDIADYGKSVKKKVDIKSAAESMLQEYVKPVAGEQGVYNEVRHKAFADKVKQFEDSIAQAPHLTPEDKKNYRSELARILWETRKKEGALVGKKVAKATDLFTHSKVTGFRIAGDALNTAFTFAGMPVLRSVGYGLMATAERASKAKTSFEKSQTLTQLDYLKKVAQQKKDATAPVPEAPKSTEDKWKYILKDLTVNSVQETFRALQGKGKMTDSKHRVMDTVEALGSVSRFAGLAFQAISELRTEGLSHGIENAANALDKAYDENGVLGALQQGGKNIASNAERMVQFYTHPIDSMEKSFSGSGGEKKPSVQELIMDSHTQAPGDKKIGYEIFLDHDGKPTSKQAFYDQLSETHSGDSIGADSLEKSMAVKAGVGAEDFVKNVNTIWSPENVHVGKGGSYWGTFMDQYKANPEYFGYQEDGGLTVEQYGNKMAAEYFKGHNLMDAEGGEVVSDMRIKSPDARVMWFMKDGELQMTQYEGGSENIETYTHEYKPTQPEPTAVLESSEPITEAPVARIEAEASHLANAPVPEVVPQPESVVDTIPAADVSIEDSSLDKMVGEHKEYLQDSDFKNYLESKTNPTAGEVLNSKEAQRLYELGEQFKDNFKFKNVDYDFLKQYEEGGLRLGVINDRGEAKFILFDRTGQNQVSPLTGRHIAISIKVGESFNSETFNKYMKLANQEHVQEMHIYNGTTTILGEEAAKKVVNIECGPDIEKQFTKLKRGDELFDYFKNKLHFDLTRSGGTVGERIATTMSGNQVLDTSSTQPQVSLEMKDFELEKVPAVVDTVPSKIQPKLEVSPEPVSKPVVETVVAPEVNEAWNKNIHDLISEELTNALLYHNNPVVKEVLGEIYKTPDVVGQLNVWEKTSPEKIQVLWVIVDREVKGGNTDLKAIQDLLLPKVADQIEMNAMENLRRLDEEEIVNKSERLLQEK